MHLLHLSDLHITDDDERTNGARRLEQLWGGPYHALERHSSSAPFDFIVVSGDLSQRGARSEYQDLNRFAARQLVPLVRHRDRARIILVPGNHDVEWGRMDTRPVAFSEKKLAEARRRPAHSWLRVQEVCDKAVLRRVVKARYQDRLRNVQEFLDGFYSGALGSSPNKHFNLLSPPHNGSDWSLHAFPDQGIAFIGLNSCHHNDELWRGASINPAVVPRIQGWLKRKRLDGLMLVAVWHHGIASDHGSPDCISPLDLTRVSNLGCTLGLHGHTHEAATTSVELVHDQLAVVSTGSLGAGKAERPDAAANQFSVARLSRFAIDVTLFNRRKGDEYVPTRLASRRLSSPARAPIARRIAPFAKRHRRLFDVGPDGITTVTVVLEELIADDPVPLASVRGSFSRLVANDVEFDGRNRVQVDEERTGDGRREFAFKPRKQRHRVCTWSYSASNALALTMRDFEILRQPSASARDRDYCAHVVEFPCDELVLELDFRRSGTKRLKDVTYLVEAPGSRPGEWVPVATHPSDVSLAPGSNSAALRIRSPGVGCRYSIRYSPAVRSPTQPPELDDLADTLLHSTRSTRDPELRALLTNGLLVALTRLGHDTCFEVSDFSTVDWMVMLWDRQSRSLLPVFGQFPPRGWAQSFPAGVGVAGHALRFSTCCGWHSREPTKNTLIYLPQDHHHAWVVAVPILARLGGDAIGVISFSADSPQNSRLHSYLSTLARQIASAGNESRSSQAIVLVVNSGFWTVIQKTRPLDRQYQRVADAALKNLATA